MSVLDAVGSIARFCVKSVEEGFSEKADIIKDCQAEAKWYGNEELFVVYQAAIRRYNTANLFFQRKLFNFMNCSIIK